MGYDSDRVARSTRPEPIVFEELDKLVKMRRRGRRREWGVVAAIVLCLLGLALLCYALW